MYKCEVVTKTGNHDFDWDLSQRCSYCSLKEVDFYESEIIRIQYENTLMKEALENIKDTDYRGNRSSESQTAFHVLEKINANKA